VARESRRAAILALASVLASPVFAARLVRPVGEQTKIDYLVGEVRTSPAIFLRNGREYAADHAASHLARKLKFAGKRVQTARDFVVGIASRSQETGKAYEIRWPDGKRQLLSEWLFERLEHYEKEYLPRTP
jgi:hypothetical protein